jgi:5'-deoxynucleotidase YfbR-like HD superfamily hydrolase
VVEDIVAHLQPTIEPRWRLAALLHDASEYVIGDMISPFKAALGMDYKAFEEKLENAIHIRFSLPAKVPGEIKALIKRGDRICAYFEAVRLAGFSVVEAVELFGAPPDDYLPAIDPWPASIAQDRYVQRFHVLSEAAGFAPAPVAFETE